MEEMAKIWPVSHFFAPPSPKVGRGGLGGGEGHTVRFVPFGEKSVSADSQSRRERIKDDKYEC